MNQNDEKELTKLLGNIVNKFQGVIKNQEQISDLQKEFSNLLSGVIDLVSFLMKSAAVIIFFLFLIIWRIFLWEPVGLLFNKFIEKWSLLTEGYQILILMFIGTIISGIIAHVAGSLLLEKIKNILKNNK